MQRSTLAACLAALGALVLAAPAQALNARSFVSVLGNDSASCQSPPTACRTFQGAHDKTAPGGEIDILDPGGYGPVTITKAISIVNDGVGVAGMVPPVGGAGITVNAGASDAISLRGLTIDGQGGSGTNGIVFNGGGSLTIRDCLVRRNSFNGINTGNGLLFKPNGAGKLTISDSVFESNNINSGISISPSGSGDVKAMLTRIEANNNGYGVYVSSFSKSAGSVQVSVFDSVAAHNASDGFSVVSPSAAVIPARLTLMQSVSANNGNSGLIAQFPQAILRIGESMVTDNYIGSQAPNGGQVLSYGTNQVDGNVYNNTIPGAAALD
jgi:hypothetical protein